MRTRSLVTTALLALATSLPAMPADDCPAYGAPTGLILEIKDFGSGPVTVDAKWTPAPFDQFRWEFVRWKVERSEDAGFTSVSGPGVFTSTNPSNGFSSSPVGPPETCTSAACLRPGGHYTFRVAAVFKYQPTCNQFDGIEYSTSYASSVSVDIPGGAPLGDPPREVLAIGDTKSPRVMVTWKPPAATPAEYVIRRREIDPTPAKGPKAETAFEVVGRTKAKVTKFVDKAIEREKAYEYVVDAVETGGENVSTSEGDPAYAPNEKCPVSAFDIWNGTYQFDDQVFTLQSSPIRDGFQSLITRVDEHGASVADGIRVEVASNAPRGAVDSTSSVTVHTAETLAGAWGLGLPLQSVGGLKMSFGDRDPLDLEAFRRIEGDLLIKTGKHSIFRRAFDAARVPAPPENLLLRSKTELCATVGAGSSTVTDGKSVVIVYVLRCLGPAPLYSQRTALEVTVENGLIASAAGGWFDIADPASTDHAVFPIGAIGPLSATRSEEASLILRVQAVAPASGLQQLTVTMRVVVDDFRVFPGLMFTGDEDVKMEKPVRTVELAINPRK